MKLERYHKVSALKELYEKLEAQQWLRQKEREWEREPERRTRWSYWEQDLEGWWWRWCAYYEAWTCSNYWNHPPDGWWVEDGWDSTRGYPGEGPGWNVPDLVRVNEVANRWEALRVNECDALRATTL